MKIKARRVVWFCSLATMMLLIASVTLVIVSFSVHFTVIDRQAADALVNITRGVAEATETLARFESTVAAADSFHPDFSELRSELRARVENTLDRIEKVSYEAWRKAMVP